MLHRSSRLYHIISIYELEIFCVCKGQVSPQRTNYTMPRNIKFIKALFMVTILFYLNYFYHIVDFRLKIKNYINRIFLHSVIGSR